ncbi:MAG: tetratricopeptide repeat protein [Candidatus Rokuibacteriota bacterium]
MRLQRALTLVALWLALAGATPLTPPPPDLGIFLAPVRSSVERPPLVVEIPLPAVPVDLPPLPPAAAGPPAGDLPMAPIPAPRSLPCFGAWLGIGSEALECGRARFQRDQFEDAAKAFESASRAGDADVAREARYWLGETYYRLGQIERADWAYRQVTRERMRTDWSVWSLHASGWTALRLGDPSRARDAFTQLLVGNPPAPLDAWGRHGLALAQYALGKWDEASQAWTLLVSRGTPPQLTRDVGFWKGDTLGRLGRAADAEAELERFTQGGAHPLLGSAWARLGWWSLAAGHEDVAVPAFRQALAAPRSASAPERDWIDAGLALALVRSGDWAQIRQALAGLRGRRSPLAQPAAYRVARAAAENATSPDVDLVLQDSLGGQLTPAARAWVLLMRGEAARAAGNRDEARTQFDLARRVEPGSATAAQAAVRLARTNVEVGEFRQALADLAPVVNALAAPDVRAAALALQGEAAYQSGDDIVAASAFQRALAESANRPGVPTLRLALAWTQLRQGKSADARKNFTEFARGAPDHPAAPEALLAAADVAVASGDLVGARSLFEQVVASYPSHPQADVARLNRAILGVRTGDAAAGRTELRDWLGRVPQPALFGRARAALAVALLLLGERAAATEEFARAQGEGLVGLATLGYATIALTESRLDDAEKLFRQARDAGPTEVAASADYGLAAVGYRRGATREFKKPGHAALVATPPLASPPPLLDVLTGLAVEERDWPAALGHARRLATDYPSSPAAADALERVAAGAEASGAWPVVREATTILQQRLPKSGAAEASWIRLARANAETGKVAEARAELERFIASSAGDPRAPRVWLALGRVRELAGDRTGALEAYAQSGTATEPVDQVGDEILNHARLLTAEKRGAEARALLERLVTSSGSERVAAGARAIGDVLTSEGDHLAAAEYYMTAAYVAPESPSGRRALLAAAKSLTTLKQNDAAAIAYRKLLAQANLPSELAEAAKRGLKELGR